ncbi:MAG: hypothetical protein JO219_00120 [Candidatus Eremiobacteraeota bacterium]|nr:hypothetical protein [Candidatus Eremiobacteraeota bacterium]MBV8365194.1 hypothetical protein [Candidatus Eremiobacteraeota bacterium]
MMSKIAAFATALLLLTNTGALADPAPNAQPTANDPVGAALVPPDLVMGHQQELGLSENQKAAIQSAMQSAQAKFTSTQWQLSAAMETLVSILKQPHVDASKALAQLDKELALEREIKHTQLQLMIAIKNELTSEQLAKIAQLRAAQDR